LHAVQNGFIMCEERGLNSQQIFLDLIHKHLKSGIKLPFNQEVRLQAGFTSEELAILHAVAR